MGNAAGRIPRQDPGEPLALSFAQEQLWLLDQITPGTPTYNVPLALRLVGPLDPETLDRTLVEILRRHQVLRTVFSEREGYPEARLIATPSHVLVTCDLTQESDHGRAIKIALHEEAKRPFALDHGPLVRVLLLRLGPESHILSVTMHHVVCDAWSLPVLIQEISQLYAAISEGRASPLPELPIQYSDFAAWQRNRLTGALLDSHLNYWREALDSACELIALPLDRPRPRPAGWSGDSVRFLVDRSVSAALRQVAQQHSASPFVTVLATFFALLFRESGQSDIVAGCPVANRNRPELEALVGYFVNSLPLRVQVSGSQSFVELLEAVRTCVLGGLDHAELPFEKMVEELALKREPTHHPLFQVLFAWQSSRAGALQKGGWSIEPIEAETGAARFEWSLVVNESADGLEGSFRYRTDLFDRITIERIVNHWLRLLSSAVETPHALVGQLQMLDAAEREQVIFGFNDTVRQYEAKLVPDLISARAQERGSAVAVKFGERELSYAELEERSNQLAQGLLLRGVGREHLVGVCMERSLELVVALLGVMKAGAAYVPLEPRYPRERLAGMVEEGGIRVVITQGRWAGELPAGVDVLLLEGWEALAGYAGSRPEVALAPGNLAYVIYTSGSTGRPKGAMNTHGGIANRLQWMQEYFGLSGDDVVLQKTPFSFDVSVWEFFWPLLEGARLVVAEPGGHQDSGYLVETIQREQVTTVHFVPSMLEVFVEEAGAGECGSLRRVICSGEALSRSLQQRFEERLECGLFNLYGPTEAAVDVTAWQCERGTGEQTVPIGHAIANTQVYVLDAFGEPAPVGVAGEVYLGGAGLGRGYVRRPGWTAERWVPDGCSGRAGARLYRTGDVGRRRTDGAIEYLGRADQQVKLRGFRIELGEIEAALRACPQVREAVVIAGQHQGATHLLAYVVGGEQAQAAVLRPLLQKSLPDYMLPSAFITLDRLPLSPNGKLDRKALPAPEFGTLSIAHNYEAPRDALEVELCRLWEESLGIPCIGIRQNFFELGGYSLMAVALVNKIRRRLSVNIPVATIFEAPTIAQLAPILRRSSSEQQHNLVLPYRTKGSRPPFFCIHAASGTVLGYASLARGLSAEQPFYAVQARGVEGEAEPLQSVAEMADTYVPEIRSLQPHGPYFLGGWSIGGLISLEMARRLQAQGETVALVALFDSIVPLGFDWESRNGARDATLILAALLARLDENDAPPNLSQLTSDEQLEMVIDVARRAGRVPPDFTLEQVRHQMRVLQTNLEADLQFRPAPYSGRVVMFRAENAIGRPSPDVDGGWSPFMPQLETVVVPGDHYSMLLDPANAAAIAELLEARLVSATQKPPHSSATALAAVQAYE